MPKANRSGSTPICCQHHIEPVRPDARLDLVEDQEELELVGERAQAAEELGAEVVVAALALDRLEDEGRDVVRRRRRRPARISRSTCFLGGRDVAQDLVVTGNDRLRAGQSRGQSNFGKYWVLRGSAVFVSESE